MSYEWSWIGSLELNIEGPSVSGGLIEAQYSATKGLRWDHCRGSRVGSLEVNIEIWNESGRLNGVEY